MYLDLFFVHNCNVCHASFQAKSYNSPGKSPAKSPRRGTRAVIGRAGRGRRRGSPKKLQYDAQQKTINVSPQKVGYAVIMSRDESDQSIPVYLI